MVCKVAPKTTSPAHRGAAEPQDAHAQEVTDYETALDIAGYGHFSRSALGACACAFFTTGVENCVMSYVLPAARCELELSTYLTGLINMAFMSGGVASAFFWGIVGDVYGRRNILSFTLLLNGAMTLAQSTVRDYRILLAARSINGFLIGGPSTLVFTYLSDLVGAKRRQFYLNIVGMSFVAAWLVLPAFAWLVIPIKMEVATILPVYSWRLYLAVASVPAFVAGFWTLCLPESPRLLSDTNRSDQALKILKYIAKVNSGKVEEFKVKKLIQDDIFVAKTLNSDQNRTKDLFIGVLKDLKMFVSKTYAVKSSLILFVFFANMAAGFGLNFWLPELLVRMQSRGCTAQPEQARLFEVTNATWRESHYITNDSVVPTNLNGGCSADMDDEVFTSGLIVGACCLLGNAACALLAARGGARGVRAAAVACTLACVGACACLAVSACSCVGSNKIAVAAASALNAASLNGNVLLIRLLLHALPPKLSGLGVCWGAWWGRAGGVASNLAVGALLDYSCPAPFIAVAALLALSIGAIMMIKLELTSEELEPRNKTEEIDNCVEKNTGLDRYISTHM
ncbi:synaptic vesicle glycoprotein 2B-like [Pectinophora gossypiella]|uniref:synaptic vesicle glycoprotein 2B-like n=1 Tax=Pectinophora gossypiella TaxID=13191 RepID=UPI00214DF782|nr:synaptic vesicle glycoprotein 2B-like [Pectinophora gossypiella]